MDCSFVASLVFALAAVSPSAAVPPAPVAEEIELDLEEVPPGFEGPKVVVPPPVRGGAMVATAHRPLVEALQKRFGPRVVDVKDVLDAQEKTGITTSDLKPPPPLAASAGAAPRTGPPPPPGLGRLAGTLGAERAILVEVKATESNVLVYPGVDGAPAVIVKVPKKKTDYLNGKWAEAIAAAVERYAAGALEAPAQGLEIGEVTAEEEPSDVRAEIAAEEARERERREAVEAKRRAEDEASDPLIGVVIGGGGAVRFLDVSGSLAPALRPVKNGVVPTASVHIAASPLRALPALRSSPWADALVEVAYRRGFANVVDPDASPAAAAPCPYDDDDLQARASYRLLFAAPGTPAGAWLPRLGLGAGGGLERVELGCALPVVSTSYPHADAFLRVTQPLVPRTPHGPASLVELDVVVGPRAVVVTGQPRDSTKGVLATTVHPSWSLDAFVVARPLPSLSWLVARAGSRVTGTHLDPDGGSLVVDDTRVSFELQLGGSL